MKDFIIRLTDTSAIDQQVAVCVAEGDDVGKAAQLAIDDMLSTRGGAIAWPLFIDIHPAENFPHVASLYGASRERDCVLS